MWRSAAPPLYTLAKPKSYPYEVQVPYIYLTVHSSETNATAGVGCAEVTGITAIGHTSETDSITVAGVVVVHKSVVGHISETDANAR